MTKLLVLALGGNALLQKGENLEYHNMLKNSIIAATEIAKLASEYRILIVHGNGPQIGLLSLQSECYKEVAPYPFDSLNAESQAMIGYILQQSIYNNSKIKSIVTLITQVLVDKADLAFDLPSKPIGPFYNEKEKEAIQEKYRWEFKKYDELWRRVVPSPKPLEVIEIDIISKLLNLDIIVIAGGGGGIPCIKKQGNLIGLEAVIDKDLTASLLAKELHADILIILTDIDAVYEDYGKPASKPIRQISASELKKLSFAAGTMQPKVDAACNFVLASGKEAFIGGLSELELVLNNKKGTLITLS